jgi:acetyltransferase-like isoleucine patch superfamily enzyme
MLGSLGQHHAIDSHVQFVFHKNIHIGNYVRLGGYCHLDGEGGLYIGDGTILAPHVTILTSNHQYDQSNYLPYDEYDILRPVSIGRGCWIGWGAMILPGITIQDGAIVAMGAVVTKDVGLGEVVGGNPAKILTSRTNIDFVQSAITDEKYYMKAKVQLQLNRRPIDS